MAQPTTKQPTIHVGTVDNAIELVFHRGDPTVLYLLQARDEDYLQTLQRFPRAGASRTQHHYIDDPDGDWFWFANVDCFDPPFAIIRARSFESAYECFCCEFERWIAVSEVDAADYPEDERHYNDNGTHIDVSSVQGFPLTLLSVHCA